MLSPLSRSKLRLLSLGRTLSSSSSNVPSLWNVDFQLQSRIDEWSRLYLSQSNPSIRNRSFIDGIHGSGEITNEQLDTLREALSSTEKGIQIAMTMREDIAGI